jgi:CRP-like cAMP-binding protein
MLNIGRAAAAKPAMALEEEPPSARREIRRAIDCLESSHDLRGVDAAALEALADGAVHFSLPAGDILFESGSVPDGVYLLASGRLGVRLPGSASFAAEIEDGELVGEAGSLLQEPRGATVLALRDSELVWLPHAVLEGVAVEWSKFSLAIAQLCARRLRRSNGSAPVPKRVFALVPNSEEIDAIGFAAQLVVESSRSGVEAAVGLLNRQAFDPAIEAGYTYARKALESLPELPRLAAAPTAKAAASSLEAEIERRRQLMAARAG